MLERRDDSRLPLEPLGGLPIGRQARGENFNRNVKVEPCVESAINLAHAAGAKRKLDVCTDQVWCRPVGPRPSHDYKAEWQMRPGSPVQRPFAIIAI